MGNKIQKQNSDLKKLMDRFDIVQELPEHNISYLQQKQTLKQFILKEITFNDKNQFNKAVQIIASKKSILDNNPHVVPLSQFMTISQDQFCSTFYKIYALFQYPNRTLQNQIEERRNQKRKFAEKQIWSILASCILGLSHLQKSAIKHQSLKSNSILLASSGVIKISDPYCFTAHTNYYILLTKRSTPHIYLAPQLCEALASQQITPPNSCNAYKSDVFTLGMIILETGLLQYQDQCYRDDGSRIHWETIKYNLERFGQIYTQQLKTMIELMLQKQQKDRPEWIQLQAYVKRNDDTSFNSRSSNLVNENNVRFSNHNTNQQIPRKQISVNQIQPVKPSIIDFVRPRFGIVPEGQYVSSTRIDQNLIQIDEESEVNDTRDEISNHRTHSQTIKQNAQTSPNQERIPPPQFNQYNPNNVYNGFPNVIGNSIGNQGNINGNSIIHPGIGNPIYNTFNNQPIQRIINQPPIIQSSYIPTSGTIYNNALNPQQNIIRAPPNVVPSNFQSTYPRVNNVPPQIYQNIPSGNVPFNKSVPITMNNNLVGYQPINIPTLPVNNYNPVNQMNLLTNYHPGMQSDFNSIKYQSSQTSRITPNSNFNDTKYKQGLDLNSNSYISKNNDVKFVIQTFKQGSRYEGEKVNGMRHGKGKFYYQDGGLYDGQWKQNKMCGRGKLFYQSGKIAYDGQWSNDQFVGYGILYNQTPIQLKQPFDYRNFDLVQEYWTRFEGKFYDDLKQGEGKLFFVNNEYFQGVFEKDNASGPGTFYTLKGEVIKGQWKENKLIKIY